MAEFAPSHPKQLRRKTKTNKQKNFIDSGNNGKTLRVLSVSFSKSVEI